MTYTYTTRNGQRVEVTVAAAFDRMAAAFKAATGCNLLVTSGTRTRAEQEAIFRQRYVLAGSIAGRKVYETRSWNGSTWYRISAAGTVANPGTSNHEDDGPNGPRSLDLHDSGADRGVTSRGSARDNWMAAHAGEYGFANDGYNFGEAWHKTFQGQLGGAPASGGGANETVRNEQAWLISLGYDLGSSGADGIKGAKTVAAFKSYQTFLRPYGYTGAIDGDWGAGTQAAHAKYYAEKTAAPAAPAPSTTGRATIRKGAKGQLVVSLQNRLNSRYPLYSKLRVDGEFGAATEKVVKEFQRRAGLTVDGIVGPKTWGALGL